MPDVGGHGVNRSLLSIEGQRVMSPGRDPEIAIEALAQRTGIALEPLREGRIVPDLAGEPRRPHPSVVGIPLDLAGGDRTFRDGAVAEEDGVPRVLPTLVDKTFRGAR